MVFIRIGVILLLVALLGSKGFAAHKKFAIMTASYNNKDYLKWNLDSVFAQTYEDWELYYIDDKSTDGTLEEVKRYVQQRGFQHKVKIIENKHKCYCLRGYYREIHRLANDRIVVTLDGDDAFADASVLSYLNEVYQNPDVWCTFGNFRYEPSENKIAPLTLKAFPEEIVEDNDFRNYDWNIHHLRSFYAGLFKNIKLEDLLFEGAFYPVGEDLAFMFPIIEQCGRHHKFINRVLYIYNVGNPLISVNVWKKELRKRIWEYIGTKNEYAPLGKPPYIKEKKVLRQADILVFDDGSVEQLTAFLESISRFKRTGSILINQRDTTMSKKQRAEIKKHHPEVVFISSSDGHADRDRLNQLFKSPFVIIASSCVKIHDLSFFDFAMRQIERTKALIAYIDSDRQLLLSEHQALIDLESLKAEHSLSAFQYGYFEPKIKNSSFLAVTTRKNFIKKSVGKKWTSLHIQEQFARDRDKVGLIIS